MNGSGVALAGLPHHGSGGGNGLVDGLHPGEGQHGAELLAHKLFLRLDEVHRRHEDLRTAGIEAGLARDDARILADHADVEAMLGEQKLAQLVCFLGRADMRFLRLQGIEKPVGDSCEGQHC